MKKRILVALMCVVLFIGGVIGCAINTEASNRGKLQREISEFCTGIFVDPETGVNYIVYEGYTGRGGITPRYNADGSLYVTEVK